jgi:inner membrane protein
LDSLTHIALGACMGDAFCGQKVGKKAMLWGALAQSIPDIDFVAASWLNTSENLLAHRGFTHSILFAVAAALLMAIFAERWHRPHNISFKRWLAFFIVVVLTHIFLDAFNNYGVGWFEPFSHYRISFNVVYVADPFFSIMPAIAFVMLLLLRSFSKKRKSWWRIGIGFCFLYLGYCVVNKIIINNDVKHLLNKQNIQYNSYFTTPAPLQSWLWFVAAGTDSGYYVGYRSVFDKSGKLSLQYFPRNASLLNNGKDYREIMQLVRFSQGYYTVEQRKDTLVFNDLRFGQVIGWVNPKEEFAFHYYIEPDIDNTLVVQRGRFAKWDQHTFNMLLKRIKGEDVK